MESNSKKVELVEQPTHAENDFPIVGIGASAGGYEAFTTFLANIPKDTGMGFVFVQHQDPTHKSNLSDLLRKSSPMPLHLVEDRMPVRPDHVYVIPPNKDLVITNNILRLTPRDMERGLHLPVDSFFRSLAENSKRKAIGVILSGTASDGTLGLKAIKAEGGITFAQDEKSAKYSGMPRHAVASDVVDYVLPVEEIAQEIGRIAVHPIVRTQPLFDDHFSPAHNVTITQILGLLKKAKGVDFTYYKPETISRRISRRMLLHKVESLQDYLRFLKENPKYVSALFEDILINVTSFFRDPETFEILKNEIFPKLLKPITDKVIRVWVPGCSSGEEAYSLAIALYEYLSDRGKHVPVQIFGTDISDSAIEKARTGIYPINISPEVSPDRLRRFFTRVDQGYQINKFIRDLCIFARHNVVKDPPFSKIDIVSCRNLLIYLGPLLQKKVMPIFHYALNPDGYLVLGSSETVGGFSDYFFPADRKYKIYSKKAVPTRMPLDLPETYAMDRQIGAGSARREELATEKDVMRE
jgi:two-component system, chemotaxis family, CheB/CheR fusion protein